LSFVGPKSSPLPAPARLSTCLSIESTSTISFKATKTGTYYGQCSELCGKDHAYMPIAVKVVEDPEFASWVETAKKKYASAPASTFASAAGPAQ